MEARNGKGVSGDFDFAFNSHWTDLYPFTFGQQASFIVGTEVSK